MCGTASPPPGASATTTAGLTLSPPQPSFSLRNFPTPPGVLLFPLHAVNKPKSIRLPLFELVVFTHNLFLNAG